MQAKINNFSVEKAVPYVAFLCGLFVLLPFKLKPVTVIVFFIFCLFSVFRKNTKTQFEFKTSLIISTFFIVYALSLFFSENIQKGITILVRCIPIILIPLGYSFLSSQVRTLFNQVFRKTFIIAASVYAILIFIYLKQLGYFAQKHDLYYCYSYITYEFWGINEHPIYISIYFSIALFFIMMEGFKNKILNFTLFVVLIFGLLILARKGVIISFCILSVVLLFLKQDKRQSKKLVFVFIGLMLLSLSVTEIRNRFLEIFDTQNIVNSKETSSGIRYILWNTSTTVIQESNYLGYGVGDAQAALSKQLAIDGFEVLAKENYNAHNQLMQIGLAAGIAGIVLYVLSLFYFIRRFIKRKNAEAVVLFLFFLFVFMFESVLERQNGILIYSWITAMFIYTSEFDTSTKNEV